MMWQEEFGLWSQTEVDLNSDSTFDQTLSFPESQFYHLQKEDKDVFIMGHFED